MKARKNMTSCAFLCPTTSRQRAWKTAKDTDLATKLLPSLNKTLDCEQCTVFIGVDQDDELFNDPSVMKDLQEQFSKHIPLEFVTLQADKGHVTAMWNQLFRVAHEKGFEYFCQCGDDIDFHHETWLQSAIQALKAHSDIGVACPLDTRWGNALFTQSVVSRKHMEIFGFYFPEELKNWYCDNWMTDVYSPGHKYCLRETLSNMGGPERYAIANDKQLFMELVQRDKIVLKSHLTKV